MKSSEALKNARRLIQEQETVYVCYALRMVGGSCTAVYDNLRRVIGERSIASWLRDHSEGYRQWCDARSDEALQRARAHPEPYAPLNPEFTRTMRQYRLAWIDWMIEGYEAVGD